MEQLHENLKATEIAPKLTPEVMKRIDEEFGVKKEEGKIKQTVQQKSAGQFSISPPGTAA